MARKKKKMPFEQQLDTLILRNQAVREEPGSHPDELTVAVPLDYDRAGLKIVARVFKAREVKRFVLAGPGLEVYRMLEGRRSFEKLIDIFAAKHQLTFFESRAFLMDYIRTLVERGVAVIGIQEDKKHR